MTETQLSEDQKKSAPPSDVVWGLDNIGAVINRTGEQTAYLAKSGQLGDAVTKLGGQWVGIRRRLLKRVRCDLTDTAVGSFPAAFASLRLRSGRRREASARPETPSAASPFASRA